MRKIFPAAFAAAIAMFAMGAGAQSPAASPDSKPAAKPVAGSAADGAPDPAFQPLAFLNGVWEAKTNGAAGVNVIGKYAFVPELKGHVISRQAVGKTACTGPDTFDCEHSDLLYIYPNGGGALKADYFDNEGHVIHYNVSTPGPTMVEFLSDGSQPGPQFRLVYERKADTLSGKFQMRMPGQADWKSYLEWSGDKQ